MPVSRARVTSSRERLRNAVFLLVLCALAATLLAAGTLVLDRHLRSTPAATPSAQTTSVEEPLPAELLARPIDYVALGDSYSAGPGLSQQLDAACQRSDSNYPSRLAARLEVSTFVDVTCTGARSNDLGTEQARPEGLVPPQLDALSAGTDLVTLSIGGNDDDVFATVVSTCPGLVETEGSPAPCRDQLSGDGEGALAQQSDRLVTRVSAVIREIRDRAPDAEVVVVGYPALFPRGTVCDELSFAPGDADWAADVVDAVVGGLAVAARNEGVRFVDLRPTSREHHVCSAQPWFTGITDPEEGAPWHPLPAGMRGAADAVATQLLGPGTSR